MKRLYVILICCLLGICFNVNAQHTRTISFTIEFVVNTDNIIKNNNYDYYVDTVLPILNQDPTAVEDVLLVGSASPEGSLIGNIKLANKRADKIYSYISTIVPSNKIIKNNNYQLFLQKTGFDESDYSKLRATYIEIHFKSPEVILQIDTVYIKECIKEIDTVYCWNTRIDTVYIKEKLKSIPVFAVKTNLLSDVLATPNIQAELYTYLWGLSFEFDYTFPWWHKDYDKYFYYQLLNGDVGIRKYFNNKYKGHWIGIYANTAIYDICFWNKDKGWQGEVYGIGIGYGYVFQSKKYPRLKFEPYVRLGWFNSKYDLYHASQPWNEKYYYNWYLRASDFVPRRFNMNYFGPTEIGFNLTFDLICIRKY